MQAVKAKANEIARLKVQVESQRRAVEASIRDINNQRAVIQNSIAENKSMIERLKKIKVTTNVLKENLQDSLQVLNI